MNILVKIVKYLIPKTFELLDQKRVRFKRRKPLKWSSERSTDIDRFIENCDKKLFEKTKIFKNDFEINAKDKLAKLRTWQGGGGAYHLLYFLVMKTRPLIILETGVASGWTTNAILSAIKSADINESRLFSSDLPYTASQESKASIGILVEKELKNNWTLCIDGDEECLKRFDNEIKKIDIFHYDSDKSYESRKFVWNKLKSKFNKDTIIIFDDIHNNFHFRDLVEELKVEYKVFKFENKFIGMFIFGGKFKISNFQSN